MIARHLYVWIVKRTTLLEDPEQHLVYIRSISEMYNV